MIISKRFLKLANNYEIELKDELNLKEIPKYKVVLLNDDYSTMDFVIEVLVGIFKKSVEEATIIMLDIHKKGKGICGVYVYEIAATKVNQVKIKARKGGFPLKAVLEEV